MVNLFTQTWMEQLLRHWNATQSIVSPLQQAGFSARIGYGFKSDPYPTGLLVIESGHAIEGGIYDGSILDWDLRATPEKWAEWIDSGFGLTKLGPAVATGALQFTVGDYRRMIRNPALSNSFLQHFELMSQIN